MQLLGVDVGFSKSRDTTGIVCLSEGHLCLSKVGTSWERRKASIPPKFRADFVAIDGPLLPRGVRDETKRRCELIFIRAPFARRCKPGLSHFGTGLKLRHAAAKCYSQFSRFVTRSNRSDAQLFVRSSRPIVEAFPNAFLAVLLPDEIFRDPPKLKRGQRFDWLYKRVVDSPAVKLKLSRNLRLPDHVWRRLGAETDHELRAALICLLTAAFAAEGTVEKVGDSNSGWFWLPPISLWEPWAKDGLKTASEEVASKYGTECDPGLLTL